MCVCVQLVVDWLEGLARVGLEQFPVKAVYFTDNVCFENTLHDLKHATDRAVLVTELVGHSIAQELLDYALVLYVGP